MTVHIASAKITKIDCSVCNVQSMNSPIWNWIAFSQSSPVEFPQKMDQLWKDLYKDVLYTLER